MTAWRTPRDRCGDHPTAETHSRVADGVRLWRCSGCGTEAPWGESWSYYGDAECPHCWRTTIEWVACSEACVLPLPAAPARGKTRGKARGCSRCGQRGHYAPRCRAIEAKRAEGAEEER